MHPPKADTVHLAAIAYNLKKLLKHTKPKAETGQAVGEVLHFLKSVFKQMFRADITTPKLTVAIR